MSTDKIKKLKKDHQKYLNKQKKSGEANWHESEEHKAKLAKYKSDLKKAKNQAANKEKKKVDALIKKYKTKEANTPYQNKKQLDTIAAKLAKLEKGGLKGYQNYKKKVQDKLQKAYKKQVDKDKKTYKTLKGKKKLTQNQQIKFDKLTNKLKTYKGIHKSKKKIKTTKEKFQKYINKQKKSNKKNWHKSKKHKKKLKQYKTKLDKFKGNLKAKKDKSKKQQQGYQNFVKNLKDQKKGGTDTGTGTGTGTDTGTQTTGTDTQTTAADTFNEIVAKKGKIKPSQFKQKLNKPKIKKGTFGKAFQQKKFTVNKNLKAFDPKKKYVSPANQKK